MRDKMSDTKVHVTDEQPWVAEGRGQHNPEHTKMDTGRDANVHVDHDTNVQDQATEQEHWERTKRGRENERKQTGKKRRVGKTEEERKWKCVRSENQKWKKKKETFFFFLREKTKHSNTPKAKSQHKGENYSVLAWWWVSGGWGGVLWIGKWIRKEVRGRHNGLLWCFSKALCIVYHLKGIWQLVLFLYGW